MKRIAAVLVVLGVFSAAAFADVPRPDKKPVKQRSIESTLYIKIDKDAKEARLVIPKSQLNELRAALDDADGDLTSTASLGGVTRIQTIAAGSFLSLAFAFGGIWLIRTRRPGSESGKVIVGVAVAAALFSGSMLVWANAGPPSEARAITGKMFAASMHIYKFGYGRIKLETTTEDTEQITLIVPDPPSATPTPAE
jgi:hypothetical protein